MNWANLETDVTFLEQRKPGNEGVFDSGFDYGGDWFCDSFCRYLARNSRGNDGAGILSLRAWGAATASLNTVSAPALSSAFAGTRMLSRQEGWDKR